MRDTFAFVDGGEMTPKRNNKTKGYFEGCTFTKLKDFNPTSRFHIAWAFQTFRGWEPLEFTEAGKPKIDESVLSSLGTDEARAFGRILELQKHLGQISEGQNAWLKKVESRWLHPSLVCSQHEHREKRPHATKPWSGSHRDRSTELF